MTCAVCVGGFVLVWVTDAEHWHMISPKYCHFIAVNTISNYIPPSVVRFHPSRSR